MRRNSRTQRCSFTFNNGRIGASGPAPSRRRATEISAQRAFSTFAATWDVRDRQTALQAVQHGGDRSRFRTVKHPKQVHERGVFAQPLAKGERLFRRFELPSRCFAEEHGVLRPDVFVERGVTARVHPLGEIRQRDQIGVDDGVLKKLINPLARFTHQGVRRERLMGRRPMRSPGRRPGPPLPQWWPTCPHRSVHRPPEAVPAAAG